MAKRHPLMNIWDSMLSRCYNKNNESYKYYGELGVTVCSRWRYFFTNFVEDMGPRPEGYTLERKNPFGNYEPDNCEWATRKEQANNKRWNYNNYVI